MGRDIFYKIGKIPKKKIVELLYEAKEKCINWWADKLDCNISWQRQKINVSFKEIMNKIVDKTLHTFIHRASIGMESDHVEVGFRNMETPDYFLWIILDSKHLSYFVKKYKLKKM